MTARKWWIALAVVLLAVAALLWMQQPRPGPRGPSANTTGSGAAQEPEPGARALPHARDLPALKGIAETPPGEVTAATQEGPTDPAIAPPLPPTPPFADTAAEELADPAQPVGFPILRFWVDRYSARHARDPVPLPGVRLDDLFPPTILARFQVPPETRIVTVDDQPAALPGTLDQAFRPQPGKTWRISLRLLAPDGALTDHFLQVRH